jgi:hypothetical protein
MRRWIKFDKKLIQWKGFQRYLYKMIISNIFLILIPICILGIFWYVMMSNQAENKFHVQKSIELNEITSAMNKRIKAINLEVATETTEKKYGTYTFSDEYSTNLSMLVNRLYTMTEKYSLIDSVYFYDRTTNIIYNSKSGRYTFNDFYDKNWLAAINEDIYSVQQIPL